MQLPGIIDQDIELRLLEPHYARMLYDIVERDRDYLRRYQNWPDKIHSQRDMKRSIQYSVQKRKKNIGLDFVVLYRGAPVGKVGLVYISWPESRAEVGYWLAEHYQGRGLITRSTRALTGYALGYLQLEQVQIRCAEENTRSRAIPERLGFVYEGLYPGVTQIRGKFVKDALYTMTGQRWYRRMIYHITRWVDWDLAKRRGEYRTPSLETRGFIHFSELSQIVPVANAVYAGRNDLALLCADPERVHFPLKYEPPDTAAPGDDEADLYPHLYGPLDPQAVVRVFDFPPNGDGTFFLPDDLPT